ncbi:Phosphatidate cytidylyltransferase [Planctomycetes bacterium Pan216]|uniref:Phosphatidate cytidylyltransferase n=1 Tax=Kolteria novifilia TaxID=2527975 RepID=A0A518B894_9BACT|nr:Phosphatidate cytidylyltransferase [Planctomycetes bacterium Pan216]
MLNHRLLFGLLMTCGVLAMLAVDNLLAPYYPLLGVVALLATWFAARELAQMMQCVPVAVKPWFVITGCLLIIGSAWLTPWLGPGGTSTIVVAAFLFVFLSMAALLISAWEYREPGNSLIVIAGHVFSLFYIGFLGVFIAELRWHPGGPIAGALAVTLAVFTPKCCDIGAYFTGRYLGRTKLSPRLSPAKTWEGAAGGVVAAVAIAFVVAAVGKWIMGVEVLDPFSALGFGLALGAAAPVGDLMESLIKRECQHKDASSHIPGFGGVLDVIDSVLFTGPLAYLFLIGIQ